jgi:uncharacterized membrane protein YdjX (TVP38/TMEM64 family)
MDTKKIIMISFISSFFITIVGALYKIMHWPYANILLTIGIVISLVYVVLCLMEISNSKQVNGLEKLMWLVGFIFISQIAGLVYILSARNRIIRN